MNNTRATLTTFTPPRRLTKQQFKVVALLYRDELNYEQVAQVMGISVRTVQMHIERAVVGLRIPGHGPSVWRVLRWAEDLLEMGFDDREEGAA